MMTGWICKNCGKENEYWYADYITIVGDMYLIYDLKSHAHKYEDIKCEYCKKKKSYDKGVLLTIVKECPNCGHKFDKDIPWKSDKSQILNAREAIKELNKNDKK